MGISFRRNAIALTVLLLAGLWSSRSPAQTQDRAGKARLGETSQSPKKPMDSERADALRLSRQLRHFRTIGDFESAAGIFERLFPPEPAGDPVFALKTTGTPSTDGAGGFTGYPKPIAAREGAYPVFVSPEPEKNPSADIKFSSDGGWAIFSAAEQWAGDRPGLIRIRKSSDRGLTWPETLVIGGDRASTHPSLRQVSDDTIGLAYVKEWDVADGDIHFARMDGELTSDASFPVALSLADQRNPSLATDRQAFVMPYIYIVYAECNGSAGSVKFRVSPDLGETWSRDITIDSFLCPDAGEIGTAMAYDPYRNALHVAYMRRQGLSVGIAAATSTDFGASWSKPVFLTPIDLLSDSSPAIASMDGTVLVVYDHETGGSGRDIGFAYSSDSGRRWKAGGRLASSAASESTPDVRVSEAQGSPRFFVSYVEENDRIHVLSSEGSAPGSLTTERNFPEEGGAAPIGSAIVLPLPNPDGGASAGILWADTTSDEDIYYSSEGLLLAAGALSVTPVGGLTSTGPVGGPFSPSSQIYTLQNTGDATISWRAAKTRTWTTLSATQGDLGAGASTTVTVSINSGANALTAGTYSDTVTFTNRTNGSGNTTRAVSLTVTAAGVLSVTPTTGLTSTGQVGGPFTPSSQAYILQNTGGSAIAWTATKTQTWTALSTASGTLSAGASTTVTVSINTGANTLAAGTYSDTVTLTNTTNGNGNTTRAVSLTITAAGVLSVTPTTGLTSTGLVGGPFTPSSQAYTLQNTGGASLAWTAAKTQTWTTLSASSGTLSAGASTTVTVSINSGANALTAGTYSDTVTLTNTTNGNGNTTRAVNLTVTAPAALSVTPTDGLVSAGYAGGPFTPASKGYTLKNTGGISLSWTAAKTQTWTTLSASSGTLSAGASTTVTVSINTWANALEAGTYADTMSFTNTTNGNGNTTRAVSLTVSASPVLSVTPGNRDVSFLAGTTTFAVSNAGGGTMPWTAAVIAGGDWLTIASGASGTDSGTITMTFSANRTASPRVGIVQVTAAGASGSPKDVTVTQSKGSISLGLGAQRLVEKAWIIQREYGKLTVTVSNPAAVPVNKYVIYRSAGGGAFQALAEVAGSTVDGPQWTYNDAFLETGTAYAYRVVALDALGSVISESNDAGI
jgi:hypothetical protein